MASRLRPRLGCPACRGSRQCLRTRCGSTLPCAAHDHACSRVSGFQHALHCPVHTAQTVCTAIQITMWIGRRQGDVDLTQTWPRQALNDSTMIHSQNDITCSTTVTDGMLSRTDSMLPSAAKASCQARPPSVSGTASGPPSDRVAVCGSASRRASAANGPVPAADPDEG